VNSYGVRKVLFRFNGINRDRHGTRNRDYRSRAVTKPDGRIADASDVWRITRNGLRF
jgi:hypothetical protein